MFISKISTPNRKIIAEAYRLVIDEHRTMSDPAGVAETTIESAQTLCLYSHDRGGALGRIIIDSWSRDRSPISMEEWLDCIASICDTSRRLYRTVHLFGKDQGKLGYHLAELYLWDGTIVKSWHGVFLKEE